MTRGDDEQEEVTQWRESDSDHGYDSENVQVVSGRASGRGTDEFAGNADTAAAVVGGRYAENSSIGREKVSQSTGGAVRVRMWGRYTNRISNSDQEDETAPLQPRSQSRMAILPLTNSNLSESLGEGISPQTALTDDEDTIRLRTDTTRYRSDHHHHDAEAAPLIHAHDSFSSSRNSNHEFTCEKPNSTIILLLILFILSAVSLHPLFSPYHLHLTSSMSPPQPCGWDYEGSWTIGFGFGLSPLTLHLSKEPLVTCALLQDLDASFVADPFLVLLNSSKEGESYPFQPNEQMDFRKQTLPAYVFFEYKSLQSRRGEIGVAKVSISATGKQVGGFQVPEMKAVATAATSVLAEPHHLSYPFVLYDYEANEWLLMPEGKGSNELRIYSTTPQKFPYGWKHVATPLTDGAYVDASPVFYGGIWNILLTSGHDLRLFTAIDLRASWSEHPSSPVRKNDFVLGRNGGRPIIYDGVVYRFAQDGSEAYGQDLRPVKIDLLTPTEFHEKPLSPMVHNRKWNLKKIHHLDPHLLTPLNFETRSYHQPLYVGVIDGQEFGENDVEYSREGWVWQLKLAISIFLLLLLLFQLRKQYSVGSPNPTRILFKFLTSFWHSWTARMYYYRLWSNSVFISACYRCPPGVFACWQKISYFRRLLTQYLYTYIGALFYECKQRGVARNVLLVILYMVILLVGFVFCVLISSIYPFYVDGKSGLAVPVPLVSALRDATNHTWPISPTYADKFSLSVPLTSTEFDISHTLPKDFYPLKGFHVVTGATSLNFYALENLIGSLHFFSPGTPILLYDLGMTKHQREAALCWDDVEVKSSDWYKFQKKHIRNMYLNAYPFLVMHHALTLYEVSSVLYIDPYREIRRPWALESIKRAIATEGYWFAETGRNDVPSVLESDNYFGMLEDTKEANSLCDIGFGGVLKESELYKYLQHQFLDQIQPSSDSDSGSEALTTLLHATGRKCAGLRSEWSVTDASRITDVATNFVDDVSAFTHVDGSGSDTSPYKPYLKFIRSEMTKKCPIVSAYQRAELEYPVDVVHLEKLHNDGSIVVNHPFVDHAAISQCLQSPSNPIDCDDNLKRYHESLVKYYQSEFQSLADDSVSPASLVRFVRLSRKIEIMVATLILAIIVVEYRLSLRLIKAHYIIFSTLLILLLVYPLFMSIFNAHGTFFPVVVHYATQFHEPTSKTSYVHNPQAFSDIFPPSTWTPSHRIVFSMSTLPSHLPYLDETLRSLASQNIRIDAIHLNLPKVNRRSGQSYEIPAYLLKGHYLNTTLQINRCEDYGPLTKLLPAIIAENDPSTLIITVDTDKIYAPDLAQRLAWFAERDPEVVYGVCGWSFLFRPDPVGVLPIYVPWIQRGTFGREVDVLQACCGNIYRRGMFPDHLMPLLESPHSSCFTTDDLWIAGFLQTVGSYSKTLDTFAPVRKQVIIPGGWSTFSPASLDPETAKWKSEHESEKKWDLSQTNTKAGVDMACIRGVEQMLGPWRRYRHDL